MTRGAYGDLLLIPSETWYCAKKQDERLLHIAANVEVGNGHVSSIQHTAWIVKKHKERWQIRTQASDGQRASRTV